MTAKVPLLRLLVAASLLAAWQLTSGRLIAEIFLSSPWLVVHRLVELAATVGQYQYIAAINGTFQVEPAADADQLPVR